MLRTEPEMVHITDYLLIIVVNLMVAWACIDTTTSMRLRLTLNAVLFVFGYLLLKIGFLLNSLVVVLLTTGLFIMNAIFLWRMYKAADTEGGVIVLEKERKMEVKPD